MGGHEMSPFYEEFMCASHRFLQQHACRDPLDGDRPGIRDAFAKLDDKLQDLRREKTEITESEYSVLKSNIEFCKNFGVRAGFLRLEGKDTLLDRDGETQKIFEYDPKITVRL